MHRHQNFSTKIHYVSVILISACLLIGFSQYGIAGTTDPNLAVILTTPPQEAMLQPPSIKRILDRGKLIVAMYSGDTPPFYFTDKNGELTGVDVYLIKGFAQLLKVDIEFNRDAKTFDGVIRKVAEREADVGISKLGITFPRAMKIRYTIPYIMLYEGLLINRIELTKQAKGREQREVIQNLKGKIGVIARSSYVENAKDRFMNMTIMGYPKWPQVVEAAVKGEVIAAYRDETEIKKIIRDKPDIALKFLTVVLKDAPDPKAMVVAWDSYHLLELLNLYISKLDLNLSANKVLDNYNELIEEIKKKTRQ
ncbi:MAG: transporter substrate-binding domain-containing protein [Desulfobacterales bacterium]|nr:transporter substrate-binding domain-containing protein [Desulfobacterales bacterium]